MKHNNYLDEYIPCVLVDDDLTYVKKYGNIVKDILENVTVLPVWLPSPETFSEIRLREAEDELGCTIFHDDQFWLDRGILINFLQEKMGSLSPGLILMDNKLETGYDPDDGWKLAYELIKEFPDWTATVITNFPASVSMLKSDLAKAVKNNVLDVIPKGDIPKLEKRVQRHLEKFQVELEELIRDHRMEMDRLLSGEGTHDRGQRTIMHLSAFSRGVKEINRKTIQDCLEVLNEYLGPLKSENKGAFYILDRFRFENKSGTKEHIENIKEIGPLFSRNKALIDSVHQLRNSLLNHELPEGTQDEKFKENCRKSIEFIENFMEIREKSRFCRLDDLQEFFESHEFQHISNDLSLNSDRVIIEGNKKAIEDALQTLVQDRNTVIHKHYELFPTSIKVSIQTKQKLPLSILESVSPTAGGDMRRALGTLFRHHAFIRIETNDGLFIFPERTGLAKFEKIESFRSPEIGLERTISTKWIITISTLQAELKVKSEAPNILYLDDQPISLFSHILENKYMQVHECKTYQEAVATFEESRHSYVAVIVDLCLQNDNERDRFEGLEFIKYLSRSSVALKVCVVQSAVAVEKFAKLVPEIDAPVILYSKPLNEILLAELLEDRIFSASVRDHYVHEKLYRKVHVFINQLIGLRSPLDLMAHRIPLEEDLDHLVSTFEHGSKEIQELSHEFLEDLKKKHLPPEEGKYISDKLRTLIDGKIFTDIMELLRRYKRNYNQVIGRNFDDFLGPVREFVGIVHHLSAKLRNHFGHGKS